MNKWKASHSLPDPFPIEILRELNFGSADGHRDDIAEQAFVVTSSIKKFLLNKNSIVVGEIGTGKSTLFRLLKHQAKKLDSYKNDLIVPLEEALSFNELSSFAKEYYQGKKESTLYQLLWKFNVLSKVAIEISKKDGFPSNEYEKSVNRFLVDSESSDSYSDIVSKLKNLVSGANFKIEAKILDNPISFEAGLLKKGGKRKKINLEEVQRSISGAIYERGFDRATVIIDKVDRFIAGVEYDVQRNFLTALLEVDDDFATDNYFNLKIFLRADLFEKLDYSSLGYDKVVDNVVFLRWSREETLRFLARRIMIALDNLKIATLDQILKSTNLSEFDLTQREKFLLSRMVPEFLKKLVSKKEKVERTTSLYGKFDKVIITKMFPRKCIHFCSSTQTHEEICIFEFINNHFVDGNNVCTPRYILTFLKEVVEHAASYYDDNPDQYSELMLIENDFEWDLFKKNCVYNAYLSSKDIYVKNIGTVDAKWTKNFNVFLAKRGNKTKFDFKWLRANISDISEDEAVGFLSFLQVIGFLTIVEEHSDIRKREYELPILYKVSQKQKNIIIETDKNNLTIASS